MPLRSSLSGYCAAVRTPRHLPTTDAAVPPTFAPPPPPLVSWRSFLLAPRASIPSAADHYLLQRVLKCSALSPEFLRPGCNPTKHPASRLFRNRCGSSTVST